LSKREPDKPKKLPKGSPKKKKPLVKCEFCDYECHGKQAMGRHVYYRHPEHRPAGAKVSLSMTTLRDLLALLENAMGRKQTDSFRVLASALTAQEVRLRVTLAAVALDKAERIACLGPALRFVDSVLVGKLGDGKALEAFTVDELATVQEHLRTTLTSEAGFLERILSLKGPASSELFRQLIGTLRAAEVDAQGLIEGQSSDVGGAEKLMRLSTAQRENVRKVYRSLLSQVQDKKPEGRGDKKRGHQKEG